MCRGRVVEGRANATPPRLRAYHDDRDAPCTGRRVSAMDMRRDKAHYATIGLSHEMVALSVVSMSCRHGLEDIA
jgi:hypothetical protein